MFMKKLGFRCYFWQKKTALKAVQVKKPDHFWQDMLPSEPFSTNYGLQGHLLFNLRPKDHVFLLMRPGGGFEYETPTFNLLHGSWRWSEQNQLLGHIRYTPFFRSLTLLNTLVTQYIRQKIIATKWKCKNSSLSLSQSKKLRRKIHDNQSRFFPILSNEVKKIPSAYLPL